MAWLQSFQELARHPKTKRASRLLDISIPTMIGHLHLLWWWCLDFAQDGDLAAYDDQDLADAALWTGDASSFVDALIQAGFIDAESSENERQSRQRRVHDWDDYGGKLLQQRNANADKVRNWREKNEGPKKPRGRPRIAPEVAAEPLPPEGEADGEKIGNGYVSVTQPLCNPLRERIRVREELPPGGGGAGARETQAHEAAHAAPPPPLPVPDDDVSQTLIAICGVNTDTPSPRDRENWPIALEVARRLSATPAQLRDFREDWFATPTAGGQRKRTLYLSNVAAHLPQFLQSKPEVRNGNDNPNRADDLRRRAYAK